MRLARGVDMSVVLACMVILSGCALRLVPAMRADFPLNDGGLFATMIGEVQRSHYALPFSTRYNGLEIPFAYPPLGFYLGALLSDITRLDVVQILRLAPPILSVLTVGAFLLLASATLPSRAAAFTATGVFVLVPGSFLWQVMGGGITRAPGLLFGLLALHQGYRFYAHGHRLTWLLWVLFSAATLLSHLEWALFLVASTLALFLHRGRRIRGVLGTSLAVPSILLITAPWWATVLSRHGLSPFLAAGQSGSLISVVAEESGGQPYPVAAMMIVALFSAFGVMAARSERALFLVGWIGLITLVDFRAYAQLVTVPAALGGGWVAGALDAFARSRRRSPLSPAQSDSPENEPLVGPPERSGRRAGLESRVHRFAAAAATMAIAWAILVNLPFAAIAPRALTPLSLQEREPMLWVGRETPPSAQFLIISGAGWSLDRWGEWFPVLSGRESVATVQGTEWLQGQFILRDQAHAEARRCAGGDGTCLRRWMTESGKTFSHVYLAKGASTDCCGPLRVALREDPSYVLVFNGEGATIFSRQP